MGQSDYVQVPDGPVYLLLMCRKGRVLYGTSLDLAIPPAAITGLEFDMPSKVKIGLSASNISAQPFTAIFENFALLTDVNIIDAEFGIDPK